MLSRSTSNSNRPNFRPSNVLRAIQKKAINIRKLLHDMENTIGQRIWEEKDDAVKLAVAIEAIASRAQNLPAEEAINSIDLLELLLDELDRKLTRILAS